jgi:phosphopantothenoylcysteine decarboxylase/phosphopantothenate--cysteine ligase
MHAAVMREFPAHDILIMAAAVADFRPIDISSTKLTRSGSLNIECVPTEDIVADAGRSKRADQRIVAFSLESDGDVERARGKMRQKNADVMVFNALSTMGSDRIRATILSPSAPDVPLNDLDKPAFAHWLIEKLIDDQSC